MDYGEILSKAWKIIWKHKILWVFGILAGCSASGGGWGGGGGGMAGSSATNSTINSDSINILTPSTQQRLTNFVEFIASIPGWVWILIVFVLLAVMFILSIATFLLGTLGETGVIVGTSLADQAEENAPRFSFKAVFAALKPYYWKVVLFRIGLYFISFIITLIIMIPMIMLITCTCCLGLFLLVPVGWLVQIMVTLTIIAIIEEDLDVFPAIARAWHLLTRNLLHALVMLLVLSLCGWIVGLIIVLPVFLIPLPFVLNLIIVPASGSGSLVAGLVISLLFFIILLPFLILLSGILRSYLLAAWTLTYRRLSLKEDLKPTLMHEINAEE